MQPDEPPPETRCGFVALIGAPNAGKSTLLNSLVGAKVSIVSRKVQTTRQLVRGIVIEGSSQVIFFSIDEGASAWRMWEWHWTVRWGRILNPMR